MGVLLMVLLIAFESLAVATVLPVVARDLGGRELYGWAFSGFLLTNVVGTVTAGRVADQRGSVLPLLVGLALFALGLLVAGFAGSMAVLIVGRVLQGLGGGALMALAYVMIGRAYPETMRARMLALLSSAWVLPALVGPAVAGVLTDALGWRSVFLLLLPLVAVAATLTLPALRRLPAAGGRVDGGPIRDAILLATGSALLLSALTLVSRNPWGALALALPGVALMAWTARRVFPAGTLRARSGLGAGIAVRGLLAWGFFGAEAFLPLGLGELRGLTPTQAGLTLTLGALLWSLGSWTQARLDGRDRGYGRRRRVQLGMGLVLCAIILAALTVVWTALPVWAGALAWAIGGFGMGLAFPTNTLIVMDSAPPEQVGSVSGALQTADVLCSALSAGLGGALLALAAAQGWSEANGLALAFGGALLGGLLGPLAASRLPARPLSGNRAEPESVTAAH
nr:MFS transporter [Deinobacterium chartae]